MKWISALFPRGRRSFLILVGLLFPLLLSVLPLEQKTFLAGLVRGFFYSPFLSLSNNLSALLDVYEQNSALKSEVARLKLERLRFEEMKSENERFREMLQLYPKADYRTIPADVVAYDLGRRLSTITIQAAEPLQTFLPVVDDQGLVGKISTADGYSATVSLLIGPNCRVAARDKRTRTLGIIKWSSGRRLLFDDVAMESDVFAGDTIISSGLGGIFPEGLVVGIVAVVDTIPEEFFKHVIVKPAVEFGSLDNVVVLRPERRESAF